MLIEHVGAHNQRVQSADTQITPSRLFQRYEPVCGERFTMADEIHYCYRDRDHLSNGYVHSSWHGVKWGSDLLMQTPGYAATEIPITDRPERDMDTHRVPLPNQSNAEKILGMLKTPILPNQRPVPELPKHDGIVDRLRTAAQDLLDAAAIIESIQQRANQPDFPMHLAADIDQLVFELSQNPGEDPGDSDWTAEGERVSTQPWGRKLQEPAAPEMQCSDTAPHEPHQYMGGYQLVNQCLGVD